MVQIVFKNNLLLINNHEGGDTMDFFNTVFDSQMEDLFNKDIITQVAIVDMIQSERNGISTASISNLLSIDKRTVVKHKNNINSPVVLIQYAILCGIPLTLVVVEPSLSSTITITAILILLIFIGGISYKLIGSVLIILIPITILFFGYVIQPDQKLLPNYQRNRIMAFLEPENYKDDLAYQQNNSVMAIGSGQLRGKGLNNNTTTSVKKGNFISEPQTDFIFAIIGEELGFVGCLVVIALILLIVIQCIVVGIKSPDFAGRLICCGVGGWIGIQSFINIGVATNVLPNTGVTLPFVSYGMTSIWCLFIGIGFVLNIALQSKK